MGRPSAVITLEPDSFSVRLDESSAGRAAATVTNFAQATKIAGDHEIAQRDGRALADADPLAVHEAEERHDRAGQREAGRPS